MSAPYHVQIYPASGAIFRGFFYKEGREFALTLEDSEGATHDGGSWPTISDADEWARLMVADILGNVTKPDPLSKYRGGGYTLVVAFDHKCDKWIVVAGGKKSGRFDDTGMKFNTREEARRAIDAC